MPLDLFNADVMNALPLPRNPGHWTPSACPRWRGADVEDARLLEAALAWELSSGRRAQTTDEAEVRKRRA